MNSFYSIIYAGINPASGDKLAVGLFMRGAGKPRFAWSKHRTALIRDLMGADAQRLLVQNLKALQRKSEEQSGDLADLFPGSDGKKVDAYELSEPYFHYLAKYSGNLLSIGAVTRIRLKPGGMENWSAVFTASPSGGSSSVSRCSAVPTMRRKLRWRTLRLSCGRGSSR